VRDGEEEPVRLAEHFLKERHNSQNLCALDLLWDKVSARSLSVAEMFDRGRSQIFELQVFQENGTPEVARWLLTHDATISYKVARLMYEPLAAELQRKYWRTGFAELVQSFATEGVSQEMLERSLLNTYEYELHKETINGYKVLLTSEFRQPHYYEADAREFASVYNPEWPGLGKAKRSLWRPRLPFPREPGLVPMIRTMLTAYRKPRADADE